MTEYAEQNARTFSPSFDPLAVCCEQPFDSSLGEVFGLLKSSRYAEVWLSNEVGVDLRFYGAYAAHGAFETSPPETIPAWNGGTREQPGVEDVFDTRSIGNGTAGAAVYTFEDPAEPGTTNVVMLLWQNPASRREGRGVMIDVGSTPTWPLLDPGTGQPYSPNEFCQALWNAKTAKAFVRTPRWTSRTGPSVLGASRHEVTARWSEGSAMARVGLRIAERVRETEDLESSHG